MSLWNRPKYGNKETYLDGKRFASRKEADRYAELALMEKAGMISGLMTQFKFEVIPKTKTERAAAYISDFVYRDEKSGAIIVEDVKSPITRKDKAYILKRKLFKWRYPEYIFIET